MPGKYRLKSEPPNKFIDKFMGTMELPSGSCALGPANFVLRGCQLKNTAWIIGVATYTGEDTKIMLNSLKARPKTSRLEKRLMRQILWIFAVDLLWCLVTGFLAASFLESKKRSDLFWTMGYDVTKEKDWDFFPYNLFVKMGNWILINT